MTGKIIVEPMRNLSYVDGSGRYERSLQRNMQAEQSSLARATNWHNPYDKSIALSKPCSMTLKTLPKNAARTSRDIMAQKHGYEAPWTTPRSGELPILHHLLYYNLLPNKSKEQIEIDKLNSSRTQ